MTKNICLLNVGLVLGLTLLVGIIPYRNKIRAQYHFYRLTNSSLSEKQKSNAAKNLGFLGRLAEPHLVMGLKEEDVATRKVSMRSLFLLSKEQDLDVSSLNEIIALLEAQDDSDIFIYGMRTILNCMPELSNINKIVDDALYGSPVSVRYLAIRAFARIHFYKPQMVIPQLIKMLSEPQVRDVAKKYLELYTGNEFDDDEVDASKWETWWQQNKDSFEPNKYWQTMPRHDPRSK